MTPKQATRLANLATYLMTRVERKNFDMYSYVGNRRDYMYAPDNIMRLESNSGKVTKNTIIKCNTTACALGWAATLPENKKVGLKLRYATGAINVSYKGHYSYSAGEHCFGISEQESFWLFDPKTYKYTGTPFNEKCLTQKIRRPDMSRRAVARRIKKVIKTYNYKDIANTIKC